MAQRARVLYLDQERFADQQSVAVASVLFPICGNLPGDRLRWPVAMSLSSSTVPRPAWVSPCSTTGDVQLTLKASAETLAFPLRGDGHPPLSGALIVTASTTSPRRWRADALFGLHPYFNVSDWAGPPRSWPR